MLRDIVINDVHKTNIPTRWDEITMEQFYRLELWREEGSQDITKALACMTSLPSEIWAKCNMRDFKRIVAPNLNWLFEGPKLRKVRLKETLEVLGQEVTVSRNAELEALGPKVAIDQKMLEYANTYKHNMTKMGYYQMSYILAAYLVASMEEDWNAMKVDAVQVAVQQMPAVDVVPLANFFLQRYRDSMKKKLNFLRRRTIRQRKEPILKRLKRLVSLERGTLSLKET